MVIFNSESIRFKSQQKDFENPSPGSYNISN